MDEEVAKLGDNRANIQQLLDTKAALVPFVGTGDMHSITPMKRPTHQDQIQAIDLHQKEKMIYQELSDLDGLGISYWNQDIIFDQPGQQQRRIERKQRSIGIPTDDENKLRELIGRT